LTGLSALALTLSVYLSWHALSGTPVIGCGGGASCDQVLSSRWATVRGILPVSGLAAGAYLAMFVASFFTGPTTSTADRRLAWGAMLMLVGAAAGSAIWFIVVQKWVVGAFCPYCMATHIISLLLAALVFWRAPTQVDDSPAVATTSDAPPPNVTPAAPAMSVEPARQPSQASPHRVIRPLAAVGLAVVGLVLAGILAALQLGYTPPPALQVGETESPLPALDPHAVPLVGSPDAPYVVSLFFDFKCSHCQRLHALLEEAIRRYNGALAFALCPAPLNTACNPYVSRDIEPYRDSCELARIGLAVWAADRRAFPAFDQWMFSSESGDRWRPRTLDAASAKAVELVGKARFDAALADPWVNHYLQTSIQLYGATALSGNAVPKLAFGSRWVTPEPNDADDLMLILKDHLAIPAP
jgi:uncharacterized membrane protein/protein-disulfide isomerase